MCKFFLHKTFFGRKYVNRLLGITPSTASGLLKILLEADKIQPVKGNGKGRYLIK